MRILTQLFTICQHSASEFLTTPPSSDTLQITVIALLCKMLATTIIILIM